MALPIPDHVLLGWLASGHPGWLEQWERWRAAEAVVRAAYAAWTDAPSDERSDAFRRYRAALEHEQRCARRYAEAFAASVSV